MSEPRIGDWMQTYTGRAFWPLDPREDEIDIRDIAHALSMQCRYAGHCKRFYSVAEHSLWVSFLVPPEFALAGLMHDAAEAYMVDLIRPIKYSIPEYRRIESRIEEVIARKYRLPFPMPPEVKKIDDAILDDERIQNMSEPPIPWSNHGGPLGAGIEFLAPENAERVFLSRFYFLTGEK